MVYRDLHRFWDVPLFQRAGPWVLLLAITLLCASGCGLLIDKSAIRIATVDGESLTRGDLFTLIRLMDDKDRPNIRNKGDLLRVLDQHINDLILRPLGEELVREGVIQIDRNLARERYFLEQGDEGEQLRQMYAMEVPPDGEQTELMRTYGLTAAALRINKERIELGTDEIILELQADRALEYFALQAFQAGELQVDPENLEREYQLRGDEFRKLERMEFLALRFPLVMPAGFDEAARTLAAEARQRLDAGESFDVLVQEYIERNPMFAIQSEIENNPNLARFRGFWQQASGAAPGAIIGPVYIPEYTQVAIDNQGRERSVVQPEAYMLLRVLQHEPERALTLEEARPMLLAPLLIAAQMERLRDDRGVEIYEDKLPDPAQFSSSSSDGLISF